MSDVAVNNQEQLSAGDYPSWSHQLSTVPSHSIAGIYGFEARLCRAVRQRQGGQPLTEAIFVQVICQTSSELGMPKDQSTDHSFRIGAATAAAQTGLEDSVIQAVGQWSSAAFPLGLP